MSFKTVLGDLEWKMSNHGEQHLTSVLRLFLLGKLTNHFWKVKSNPECFCEIPEKMFSLLLAHRVSFILLKWFWVYQISDSIT